MDSNWTQEALAEFKRLSKWLQDCLEINGLNDEELRALIRINLLIGRAGRK